jgi:hypothetical protein
LGASCAGDLLQIETRPLLRAAGADSHENAQQTTGEHRGER